MCIGSVVLLMSRTDAHNRLAMTGGLANRIFENIAVQNADKELHYPMDIIFQFIDVS